MKATALVRMTALSRVMTSAPASRDDVPDQAVGHAVKVGMMMQSPGLSVE